MRSADDDSGPVPYETVKLPRAVLNWKTPRPRGLAGRGPRAGLDRHRTPVSRRDPWTGSHAELRVSTDELDDDAPTAAIPVMIPPRPRPYPDALQVLRAHAALLWGDRPLRAAAILAGVAALIGYLALDGARHRSHSRPQTVLAPAAALPRVAPIIVEQLNEAREPHENGAAALHGERSRKLGRRRPGRRAHETSLAAMHASKGSGDQAIAPAPAPSRSESESKSESESREVERSGTTVSSSSAGLPAWGAVAVRDFSGAESSVEMRGSAREQNEAATVTTRSQALTMKPVSSSADIPSIAANRPGAREQPKPAPIVATEAAAPPEPVAPPRPSEPLTMEQMLNQVEEAAQAQRKRAGLKAPTTSQRDLELDALINGAMKSKKE